MSEIFQRKKLVKSMSRAHHLGRLLCRFKFEPQHINNKVKNCGKNCGSYPYLLKAYLYQFNWVNKTFLLKNFFNCESSDLIFVFMCEERRIEYIGEKGCLVKERINIYRQHITRSQYQEFAVEENLHTCGDGKFHMIPFFKINR